MIHYIIVLLLKRYIAQAYASNALLKHKLHGTAYCSTAAYNTVTALQHTILLQHFTALLKDVELPLAQVSTYLKIVILINTTTNHTIVL
jgi:hypothetical protein